MLNINFKELVDQYKDLDLLGLLSEEAQKSISEDASDIKRKVEV